MTAGRRGQFLLMIKRWKLMSSPANSHETFSMELQGDWEPSCNSGACRHCTSTRSHDCVFVSNMVKLGTNEMGSR